MNELQEKLLESLKELIRVCEKHNLRYYLFGGSCLGAVRHKGFIPWDDDLDVAMPRPDFNKLMKLKDEFKEPFFLQNQKTDKAYPYTFAKIRNSSTTFLETAFAHHNINHGVYLDIFPLDGMKRKGFDQPKTLKPYLMWFMWYFTYLGHLWMPLRLRKLYLDIPLNLVALIFTPFILGNWMSKLLSKYAQSTPYEKATLVGPYLTMYFNRDSFKKEIFGEGVDATFEGLKVKLPSDYKSYLTQIYRNYMKLPPVEKQKGHHYQSGYSMTIGYKDYIFYNVRD